MGNMNGLIGAIFFVMLLVAIMSPLLAFLFLVHRANTKAAAVLKIYAEKGEEPPQSVIDAFGRMAYVGESKPKAPPTTATPQTRGSHFSDAARNLVIAIGAAGIAWWRAPAPDADPGAFVILAVIVALWFAAGAVWHLVMALHTRDGR